MRLTDLFPSRFFKADDVTNPVILTIAAVSQEVMGEGQEEKPVVYFEDHQKCLALNKTNAERIANLVGSDTVEDWYGAKVELFRDTVMFHGARTPCVRVRKPRGLVSRQRPQEDNIPESWEDSPARG